ncbi:MAG: GDYXXLXY domain-containing protein [Alphaproteobacteria bacterium]|nr:GDYXXLXY domain-containing protein [Alphaproteobacteria bacterium]
MMRLFRLLAAVALLSLVLVAMVGLKQFTLATGATVVLETVPIDPRSLFRGDFVRLNYTISDLPLADIAGDSDFAKGDTVFVRLRRGPLYGQPISLHKEYPPVLEDHVVIKGRITRNPRSRVRIRYGIESFFIPEGEGLALERPPPGSKVTVLVAIDRYGKSAIKAVLVDGEPRYSETLF